MPSDQSLKTCVKCDWNLFGLKHERKEDFVLSQWCDCPLPYAILRSLFALYCVAIVLYSGIENESGAKIVIWLTYWSYYVLTAHFIISTANTWTFWLYDRRRRKRDFVQSKWFTTSLKIQWCLFIISANAIPLISVLFWVVVYSGNGVSFVTMNTHGINVLLVILDFIITRSPIRLHHFYISAIYCATYAVFSVIYWAVGGTNHREEPFIYSVLDYKHNLGIALVFLFSVTLVISPLIHCVLYAAYRLRVLIHRTLSKHGEKDQTPETAELEKLTIET